MIGVALKNPEIEKTKSGLFRSLTDIGWRAEARFLWVGDYVDIALWLEDNPSAQGIFNVGTGEADFEDWPIRFYRDERDMT